MNTSNSTLEQFNIQVSHDLTWNVMPLLHQIKHALNKLLESNVSEIIDLRSIPLAPGEEEKLLNILGNGEVKVQLDALGPSEIIETKFNGVWLITHFNDDNEIMSRHIEITRMPEILFSQNIDINTSYEELVELLEENESGAKRKTVTSSDKTSLGN